MAGQGAWHLLQPLALLILPVTAGLDLGDNQVDAALIVTENAITADQKASTILTTQVETCHH